MKKKIAYCFLIVLLPLALMAQKGNRILVDKCATMQRLAAKFAQDPQFQLRFEQKRDAFNNALKIDASKTFSGNFSTQTNKTETVYIIPVVFHIVLSNPTIVTDAQIQAQLDTLNKDYSGNNGDSVKVPSYFKPLFGKSKIQFCLAKRTPEGEATNGIERITTTQASFTADDGVKHVSSGGVDGWDYTKYYNVWICPFSNGLLGYATFPEEGATADQGVVIDYRSLPGAAFASYNGGKTLSHETGHYFNLYHIWGDDNGACWGTDYVDDTPNQGNSTSGCYTGIKTDNCTTDGNGIMYQNYMDYSDDNCMVMFTAGQVARMESALLTYRSSLLSSDGCQPPVQRNYDAQLKSIDQPSKRLCSNSFTPVVTIRNRGIQTLTSLLINVQMDGINVLSYNWSGSLAPSTSATVSLNSLPVSTGIHALLIYTSFPDNKADENTSNDTLRQSLQYYPPMTTVSEGFEGSTFPPAGWDIINGDNSITWQRTLSASKTGMASAMIDNYNYSAIGQKDDLRMPTVALSSSLDSAYLAFQVAAATYTDITTANNNWDTLEVLVSTDCGQTYSSIYKKWGSSLVTRTAATQTLFIPSATEWRKDSVNLAGYIGNADLLLAFRNTTGNENTIYLDDINLRTVKINPNLKAKGFLVTPNPTSGLVALQFYPQPVNLVAIQVYNSIGQKINEMMISNGQANNYYNFNLGRYAAGTYFVKAVYTDKVLVRKVVKY